MGWVHRGSSLDVWPDVALQRVSHHGRTRRDHESGRDQLECLDALIMTCGWVPRMMFFVFVSFFNE